MTSEATQVAADTARDLAHSTTLRRLAQAGLLGYALLHLLIAWLVLRLAWGGSGRLRGQRPAGGNSADQSGAMAVLARSPAGHVLLGVLAVGLAGLCLWQGVEVVRHHRRLPPPGQRLRALAQLVQTVGTAVMYGYLAVSAARAALGDTQHRGEEKQTVRGVLSWPGGRVIVVAVAVVTLGIGLYLAVKGLRSGFRDEFDLSSVRPALRRLTHRFAQAGFVLKGLALVLVGVVVGWAAVTFDPAHATGLDGALRDVATAPYGRWVLTVVAAGLASFAVYLLARARHPVG